MPFFKVDGSDLRVDLPITLYEAVLGGKVRVPTLGNAVELSIPKNTSSGRTFRLKGKGLPKAGGRPATCSSLPGSCCRTGTMPNSRR